MRKNIVKTMVKAIATTAMVIGIATTVKVDAQAAVTIEEFAAACNHTVAEVKADKELYDFYKYIKDDNLSDWLTGDSATTATATTATATTKTSATAKAGEVVNHKEMLDLVNADRKANGAGNLVWNTDLEVIAQQRAVEAMANFQSPEMANAVAAGDHNAQRTIGHKGARVGTGENLIWVEDSFGETAEIENAEWIASAGHHKVRTKATRTQYACASYICPTTGQMVWVEIFQ